MEDKLQFKVSAELKNILGRDLITSPDVAVLELVKNSYDAHAQKVEIIFDDDHLSIADNGKGMTKDDLINKWLFVAYSAKSDGTEDKSYRGKIKRHFAGAKGIGRISCDRLARNLKLTTRSAGSNKTEIIYVNWDEFERDKKTEFDNIDIPYETSDSIPKFPLGYQTGTILEFRNLRSQWSRKDILRLKRSLEKMINPFSETDDDFKIEIIAPNMKEEDEHYSSINQPNEIVNGNIENTIAEVLKVKTTQIESHIDGGIIRTTLIDRGILMYEIEESNSNYSSLSSVSISLFYLNQTAKYNFTAKMGIAPIQYGNVFLFRNGFRILPFGDSNDDSWNLNFRQQQGYARFLGTRDLFGRVDVETDDANLIKEVSSRDGGLIQTHASKQLIDYFTLIHRRLERYVVGVLWGEGFVRKDYFINQNLALEARTQLQETDKNQESANHLYNSIGSKVDFMQLIRSLANDKTVTVLYYNETLADIVSNPSDNEIIQAQMFEDFRKMTEKTKDTVLIEKLGLFQQHLNELRRQKEKAERKAEEERKAKEEAQKKAEEERKKKELAEQKQKEAEQKQKEAEADRNIVKQKNKYLEATRNTTKEVQDLIHAILLSSTKSRDLVSTAKYQLVDHDYETINNTLDKVEYYIEKIHKLSKMITKADLSLLSESKLIDIQIYIQEYLSNYADSLKVKYYSTILQPLEKKISILDLSIIMDNLVSNSVKANASELRIDFSRTDRTYVVDFTDNGVGVDLNQFTPNSIFEEGITNRRGGSGIGLSTIKDRIKKELNGSIEFLGNGLYFNTGATFRLTFN